MTDKVVHGMTNTTILTLIEVVIFFAVDIASGLELILLRIATERAPKVVQVLTPLSELA
jgi:hypothetical protein